MESGRKVYLGDAVYASFDGYHIWLETSDGFETTNRIALEPDVFRNLLEYQCALLRELQPAETSLEEGG